MDEFESLDLEALAAAGVLEDLFVALPSPSAARRARWSTPSRSFERRTARHVRRMAA
jgi:hypothetical protein